MSKKKWLLAAVLASTYLILVLTIVFLGVYIKKTSIQNNLNFSVMFDEEKSEHIDSFVEKSQGYEIHIGILLPQNLIPGYSEEDSEMAKKLIFKANELSCVTSGDFQGGRGFIFKGSVSIDDNKDKLAAK